MDVLRQLNEANVSQGIDCLLSVRIRGCRPVKHEKWHLDRSSTLFRAQPSIVEHRRHEELVGVDELLAVELPRAANAHDEVVQAVEAVGGGEDVATADQGPAADEPTPTDAFTWNYFKNE